MESVISTHPMLEPLTPDM